MYRRLALLAVGLVLVGGSSLMAQDAILGQMYGTGVHAYFAGDFAKSHKDLTTAIDGGSRKMKRTSSRHPRTKIPCTTQGSPHFLSARKGCRSLI